MKVYVVYADNHDYDYMAQWLVGVYVSEQDAIAAGEADKKRYNKTEKEKWGSYYFPQHNYSIEETELEGVINIA